MLVDELVIQYRTDDPKLREVVPLYWLMDEHWCWVHKVTALSMQFEYKSYQTLVAALKEHTVVYPKAWTCPKCGRPTRYLRAREGFSYSHIERYANVICTSCKPSASPQQRLGQVQQPAKRPLPRPQPEGIHVSFVQQAFDAGRYEALDGLHFGYLQALVATGNTDQAARQVGVSAEHGRALLQELLTLQIAIRDELNEVLQLANELQAALKQYGARPRVKSIFTSPRVEQLYRQLKREHLFVFPEVPLAAIIERAGVAHLFTKRWHADYFLKARLDFVVCDHGGVPYLAIEYQGGYHNNADVQRRDRFKARILEAVGLKLQTVRARDLR